MNKSMEEVLTELKRPFHSSKVKFKVASNTKGQSAICVAYVDARDVQERLNDVCEGFWSNKFREIYDEDVIYPLDDDGNPETHVDPIGIGKRLRAVEATVIVLDISHSDVGAMDNMNKDFSFGFKALWSDAFKRACVPFGIAAPLYHMPQLWLEKNDVHFKMYGDKPGYMKPGGEDVLRQIYKKYLVDEGVGRFGEPL